ncbi:alpha/beta hydrolase [Paraglaciecola agarilytica]|uniref:alpha/beta fold hydrolase n=1 Tax=Paraglaciecola chathamensis TaxID=368405 RepID=UPI001C09D168|nr:alpha/beta hydrolase [Paraglaciecola agarilytica]MBU3018054.1 alpha/beta hydrolase [Paraglaciecola agarilytica]
MPSFPVLKHYVTLGGDAPWQLHYRSQGADHLPVIVLLHASPMSSANMLPIMNALSDSFKVIALDTPGYGQSDPLPQYKETQYKDTQLQAENGAKPDASLTPYVQALNEFIDALELKQPLLYGSATGAQIAIEYAKAHPDSIKGMVLENAAWFKDDEREAILAEYFPDISPQKDGSHLALVWKMSSQLFHYFPWFDTSESARVGSIDMPAQVIQDTLMGYLTAGENYHLAYRAAFMNERPEQLQPVTVPTHILRWPTSLLKQYVDRLDDANLPPNIQMRFAPAGIEGRFTALKQSMLSLSNSSDE